MDTLNFQCYILTFEDPAQAPVIVEDNVLLPSPPLTALPSPVPATEIAENSLTMSDEVIKHDNPDQYSVAEFQAEPEVSVSFYP